MIDWNYNRKYTDKFRNDPSCGHSFKTVYEPYLKDNISILEVGTQQGGFIKFCKDQLNNIFFVGADLYSHPAFGENNWIDEISYNDMADNFYNGNAFSEDFLNWISNNNLLNKFDLVIDDGPHTLESQVWLIKNCSQLLSENGIYVCEDIASYNNAIEIQKNSPYPEHTFIWDNSNETGRFDDRCIIIDRNRTNQ